MTLLITVPAISEDKLVQEGILDHMDKERRGPVLTVGAKRIGDSGQILADAYIPYKELNRFPIRFEFYVNGELYSSQLRSPELNRAVGITVPREKASIPFNYQVVATLLTPNRVYTTVIQGAVFESDLSSKASCDISIDSADLEEEAREYRAESVDLKQSSSSSIDLSFTASSEESSIEISGVLSVNGNSISGTLTTTESGETVSRAVSGTFQKDQDNISNLRVSGENFQLTCFRLKT